MTCATHRVDCRNSQIQQQQRVVHLAESTSGCNNDSGSGSGSERYTKVKSCKLMSTQQRTIRTHSIFQHYLHQLQQQQQQQMRAAEINCNGASGCNTEELLAVQQEQKQQQQTHNYTTSKMYDNSNLQHSLDEVEKRKEANTAPSKTVITTTTNATNANSVQSRRHQQLSSVGIPLGERISCSKSNNNNGLGAHNSCNNTRQRQRQQLQQQQQKMYYRYIQSFVGYTQLFSVLLLFALQHFPSD